MDYNIRNRLIVPAKEDRNQEIYRLRLQGETFSNIAKKFSISAARARYLITTMEKKYKNTNKEGKIYNEFRQFKDVKFKE
jgi:DNA-binding CsgD family transcriptional regulator